MPEAGEARGIWLTSAPTSPERKSRVFEENIVEARGCKGEAGEKPAGAGGVNETATKQARLVEGAEDPAPHLI